MFDALDQTSQLSLWMGLQLSHLELWLSFWIIPERNLAAKIASSSVQNDSTCIIRFFIRLSLKCVEQYLRVWPLHKKNSTSCPHKSLCPVTWHSARLSFLIQLMWHVMGSVYARGGVFISLPVQEFTDTPREAQTTVTWKNSRNSTNIPGNLGVWPDNTH